MKKKYVLPLLILAPFLRAQQGNVGINTETPRVKLEVSGSYRSDKIITGNLDPITAVEKDRYLLLNHSDSDNRIRRVNPNLSLTPGLASIVTYKLTNINLDWVERFNTKINATDYSLMVLSAYFDRDVVGGNMAIPSYGVKNVNNEWILYADYSQVASTTNGTWTFVCAIYPKTYVKIFEEQPTFDLNGTSIGTDTTPILN